MERLLPSDGDWDELGEWDRSFYVNCVKRLLKERALLVAGFQLSDDDIVLRGTEETKQP
jgi:hypothetical protein